MSIRLGEAHYRFTIDDSGLVAGLKRARARVRSEAAAMAGDIGRVGSSFDVVAQRAEAAARKTEAAMRRVRAAQQARSTDISSVNPTRGSGLLESTGLEGTTKAVTALSTAMGALGVNIAPLAAALPELVSAMAAAGPIGAVAAIGIGAVGAAMGVVEANTKNAEQAVAAMEIGIDKAAAIADKAGVSVSALAANTNSATSSSKNAASAARDQAGAYKSVWAKATDAGNAIAYMTAKQREQWRDELAKGIAARRRQISGGDWDDPFTTDYEEQAENARIDLAKKLGFTQSEALYDRRSGGRVDQAIKTAMQNEANLDPDTQKAIRKYRHKQQYLRQENEQLHYDTLLNASIGKSLGSPTLPMPTETQEDENNASNHVDRPSVNIPRIRADNVDQPLAVKPQHEERFLDLLQKRDDALLQMKIGSAKTVEGRHLYELQALENERKSLQIGLERMVISGELTQSEADILSAKDNALIDARKKNLIERAGIAIQEQQLLDERQLGDFTVSYLQIQASIAETAKERNAFDRKLLDDAQKRAREDLEVKISRGEVSDPDAAREALGRVQVAQNQVFDRDHASPLQKYFAEVQSTGEVAEKAAVNGLETFNQGLIDIMMNGGSAIDVLRKSLNRFLADMLDNSLRKIEKKGADWLGGLFEGGFGFGGASDDEAEGDTGGWLSGLFSSSQARAVGGAVTAGNAYVVGERRAELFVPNVSGFIQPSLMGMGGGGGNAQAGGGGSAPYFDLRGAVMTQDLINQMNLISRRHAGAARKGAVSDAARAAPGVMNSYNSLGTVKR